MSIRRLLALWLCPELAQPKVSEASLPLMTNAQMLVALADAFASHANVSHWRVSYLARGDGQFFDRLRKGKTCTIKTATTVLAWFDQNWPSDLDWPRDIPRPHKSKKEAA